MISWDSPYGCLVFDRDVIVRAALRAYIETHVAWADPLKRLLPTSSGAVWVGDLQRGAFYNDDGCGDYDVVAWTDTGVVGLAFSMGFGPLEQLGLRLDQVTGGPDDVREAVSGLPSELESAFLMAAGMLKGTGPNGEKLAGVGFWFHGDRFGGTLFDTLFEDPELCGVGRLVCWGALKDGRLPMPCPPDDIAELAAENARRGAGPIEAIVDAVTARALSGPTELTADEIATLVPATPEPARLLSAQWGLHEVGITWPGLPKVPAPRRPNCHDPFLLRPTTVLRSAGTVCGAFDRSILLRVALHVYVENVLAKLDPLGRHPFPVCDEPNWTGDFQCGGLFNGVASGDYDVVAWTESGVVALTYKLGFGPLEQLGLAIESVTGGPDDVRAALPGLPAELEPALVTATDLLRTGPHREKLASVGFWLHDGSVAGTLFDMPTAPGVSRLGLWCETGMYSLRAVPDPKDAKLAGNFALWTLGPILDVVDAVVERALINPTELTPDELATLLPTPPDPSLLLTAQRRLQKVGITWPGSPEIPEEARPTGANS